MHKVQRAINRIEEGLPAINGKERKMKDEREFLCGECPDDRCLTKCKLQEQSNKDAAGENQ